MSEAEDGTSNNGTFASGPSLSDDGGVIAYVSDATNLAPGDTNGQVDGFVRQGQAAANTRRVSLSSGAVQSNGRTYDVDVSGNGKLVAFTSAGSNLVAGDTNGVPDVFVRDLDAQTTERVSVSSTGAEGNGSSFGGMAISGDGRYVAFTSSASNLVAGDTNNTNDIFVRDRQAGTTERVSVSSAGAQGDAQSAGASMSDDGRFVVWGSGATNLVAGDTNATYDGFIRDRQAGTTERFNVSSSEAQAETGPTTWYGGQSVSDDGRYVTFVEDATNLIVGDANGVRDVFVRDRQTGLTERVSESTGGVAQNNHPTNAAISGDGNHVTYLSDATNLVSGDTNGLRDVFVRDLSTDTTTRIDETYQGGQAPGGHAQFGVAISQTGTFVAFDSAARLTPRDTTTIDVYIRDVTRPGFDIIYRTANYDHDCNDGELPCQTDDAEMHVFAEDSLTADDIGVIETTLTQEFGPTSLDVTWDTSPTYEGDTETDVIYQSDTPSDPDFVAESWCDDAVGGTDLCDQHYVRFDPDFGPVSRHTTCHETGHAVGLGHGDEADPPQPREDSRLLGCMVATNNAAVEHLGNHNVDMIKAIYPQ